jgi:hypothetical protein
VTFPRRTAWPGVYQVAPRRWRVLVTDSDGRRVSRVCDRYRDAVGLRRAVEARAVTDLELSQRGRCQALVGLRGEGRCRLPASSAEAPFCRHHERTHALGYSRAPINLDLGSAGVVYVIGATGSDLVKIGFTVGLDATDRLQTLRIGSPVELSLLREYVGWQRDESAAHRHFAAFRVRGEWFRLDLVAIDGFMATREMLRGDVAHVTTSSVNGDHPEQEGPANDAHDIG